MDLKDTITKWQTGMCLLDNDNSLDQAVTILLSIRSPSAKIIHNVGCVKMRQGLFSDAIQFFSNSLERDKYLGLSYFQRGVCYYETQRFDRAELDFLTAQSLCPRDGINYRQLGADFVLTPDLLGECLKVTRQISRLRSCGQLPEFDRDGCLFWPPKKMVENLVKQDFLGKAKVISSTAETDIVYAADKKPSSPSVPGKTRQFSSSSSLRKQVIVTPSGAKVVVPPRPNRPPPTLPADSDSDLPVASMGQKLMREKSKSAEDILDGGENQDYSLAHAVNNYNSGSKLNMGVDLASVLTQHMKSGQALTLPVRRSAQVERGFQVNQLNQGKSQDRATKCVPGDPHSRPVGTGPRPAAQHNSLGEESAGKKTVRELASNFSRSGLAVKPLSGSGDVAKSPKPARPPPPKIRH